MLVNYYFVSLPLRPLWEKHKGHKGQFPFLCVLREIFVPFVVKIY